MTTIPVEMPQELRDFIESKVKDGRYASASDYIVALVTSARNGRSAIESALLEGLESGPAEEWTGADWVDLRQLVMKRHQGN